MSDHENDTDEKKSARDRMKGGLGMLSAFKEALEETIHEARERGDLSTDKAKEKLRGALDKAKAASVDARDRFDFVTQADFDDLKARVADLEDKVRSRIGGAPPSSDGGE